MVYQPKVKDDLPPGGFTTLIVFFCDPPACSIVLSLTFET